MNIIRKLVLGLLLLGAFSGQGATIIFPLTNWVPGVVATNKITISSVGDIYNDGTYLYTGTTILLSGTTNGLYTNQLNGGNWEMIIQQPFGYPPYKPFIFDVPFNDTNTYTALQRQISGGNTFVTRIITNSSPGTTNAITNGQPVASIGLLNANVVGTASGATNVVGIVQPTNGGSGTSVARSAGNNIGIYQASPVGGNHDFDKLLAKPSFEGQHIDSYGANKIFVHSIADTTNTIRGGHNFLGGINQIGDADWANPNIQNAEWIVCGGKENWTGGGDHQVTATDFSTNGSGSGWNCSVMAPGFGLTNITVSSIGSGYAVGDYLFLSGGTLSPIVNNPAVFKVLGVNGGGGITNILIAYSGEYATPPSGLNTPTTSGGGSGFTATPFFLPKNIHVMQNNSAAFFHGHHGIGNALSQDYTCIGFNTHSTYNKGFIIFSPGASGLDSGNSGYFCVDAIGKVTGVPLWQLNIHVPADAGYLWASYTDPATGKFYTYSNIYTGGSFNGNGAGVTNLIATNLSTAGGTSAQVLTVSSGGKAVWATPSGGGSSYTATFPVKVTGTVISDARVSSASQFVGDYSMTTNDFVVFADNNAITLPDATLCANTERSIYDVGGNGVFLMPFGAQTINGTSYPVEGFPIQSDGGPEACLTLISDGANWQIKSYYQDPGH